LDLKQPLTSAKLSYNEATDVPAAMAVVKATAHRGRILPAHVAAIQEGELMEIKDLGGTVLFALETEKTVCKLVTAAVAAKKSLYGANLRGADLGDAYLGDAENKSKVYSMRVLYGLYKYQIWAVLFEDGSRWVRMGCLFYSLERWDEIGIRQSNIGEYPEDGSDRSEERVAAFEFAKAAVLRLKQANPAVAQ
jgi:hypothetical protein